MKKKYMSMDAVIIPLENSFDTTGGTSNCVLTTDLETTPGSPTPCDLTPEQFWIREWFGNNEYLN